MDEAKQKFRLTSLERAWILYDVGNSAFVLMIATLVPIFFNALAEAGGVSKVDYLAYWGYASSIVTVVTAILGPILGTLADTKGFKKPIFMLCLFVGVIGCCAMGLAGTWLAFLVIFIIAKIGYSGSLVFYDSMLGDVTTPERMDMVSSRGYAWGYIGSCVPFVVCLALVLGSSVVGLSQMTALSIALVITAVWWLAVTLPLLKKYRQINYVEVEQHAIRQSFVRIGQTLKHLPQDKQVFWFLLAFFCYIDGVYTIIDMATAYGTALGLDTTGLLLALLVTQIVAFPSALIFGRLSQKYASKTLIPVCIAAYTGIAVFAFFLKSQWQFWVLAVVVGMFQGGVQALSRSHFAKIIPQEKSGEYFGLFDICGKGASFLGTMIVSVGSQLTGSANVGVGSLIVLFVVVFIVLDVFYSMRDISYWGMIPAISSDSHERSVYTALGTFTGSIGYNGITIVVVPIVTTFSFMFTGSRAESQSGWTAFGIITALLGILTAWTVAFGTKENESVLRSKADQSGNPLQAFAAIVKNDQLLWVALSYLLYAVANVATNGVMFYLFKFVLNLPDAFAITGVIPVIAGLVMAPLYPALNRRIPRRYLFCGGMILMVIGYVLFILDSASLPVVIVALILFYLPGTFIQMTAILSLTDSIEYGQLKTGKRNEAVTLSVRPMLDKIAGALSNGIH